VLNLLFPLGLLLLLVLYSSCTHTANLFEYSTSIALE
jgi:hypothetical protein